MGYPVHKKRSHEQDTDDLIDEQQVVMQEQPSIKKSNSDNVMREDNTMSITFHPTMVRQYPSSFASPFTVYKRPSSSN